VKKAAGEETVEAPSPSAEVFAGDITHWPSSPALTDTREPDESVILKPYMDCALILTPGQPVNIPIICQLMAPLLGLSPEGTHHAILRRRGILIDGLEGGRADRIASQMAEMGQSVSVVPIGQRMDFGPPPDVLTFRQEGTYGRFATSDEIYTCRWSQAILFGAGLVVLAPNAPGRGVIDLYFVNPRIHLRIWENTFLYPRQWESETPERFLRLVMEIENNSPGAVRTRSWEIWLRQKSALPAARFWSEIEYNNFLRWHLMAYHLPKKVYGQE
jgi:hypothetical protein